MYSVYGCLAMCASLACPAEKVCAKAQKFTYRKTKLLWTLIKTTDTPGSLLCNCELSTRVWERTVDLES